MKQIKVMILQQKRGEEKIVGGQNTGEWPGGMVQSVAYHCNGHRIQRMLKAGDIVDMDSPDAKKYINMGLCQKAKLGDDITVAADAMIPGYCPMCGTKLETDEQKSSGYCCEDCQERSILNREEEEALKSARPKVLDPQVCSPEPPLDIDPTDPPESTEGDGD